MEERLQKVLARAGIASRRKAEELILEGRVSVNGRAIRELGTKVDASLDEIAVDTIPIPRTQAAGEGPRTYLLLYKPVGVVTTSQDTHGRPTVLDLVPPFEGKRLYPVGRLDEDSEGLVLLTNDGDLTARLTHPRYGVPKVYEVRVRGRVTREDAERFERGVWLSEGRTGPSRVFVERAGRDVSHVRITLTEGRNREIRRAFAKLEFPVLSIRRIQIGPIVGRGLEPGSYRPLAPDEVEALHASAQGEGSNAPMRRHGRTRRGPPGDDVHPRPRRRGGKPDPAARPPRTGRTPGPSAARAEERAARGPREGGRSRSDRSPRGGGRPPGAGGRPPRGEGRPFRSGEGRPPRGEGRPFRGGEGRPPRGDGGPPRGAGRPPRGDGRREGPPPRGEGRPPRGGRPFGGGPRGGRGPGRGGRPGRRPR